MKKKKLLFFVRVKADENTTEEVEVRIENIVEPNLLSLSSAAQGKISGLNIGNNNITIDGFLFYSIQPNYRNFSTGFMLACKKFKEVTGFKCCFFL